MNDFTDVLKNATDKEAGYFKDSLDSIIDHLDDEVEKFAGHEALSYRSEKAESLKNKIECFRDSLDDFIEANRAHSLIKDYAHTLNLINFQIAELTQVKEQLEQKLSTELQHGDEGSKTYGVGKYNITVTTGYNYTLDKEEYASLKNRLPAEFNPVVERIAFDINKKIIRDAEKYASSDDLDLLSQIIIKKPKKLHVKITANV